jgi:hypothetical protein
VSVDEEPLELLGAALLELLPLLDWSLEPGALDDELELGELGLEPEPDMEPELDPGEVLEPEDDEEPDGEDGSVLEDEPLEDLSREAPPEPELAPLSQP